MSENMEPIYISQLILNILILPVPVLLMAQVLRRGYKTTEIRIFFRMLFMNVLLILSYITGLTVVFIEKILNETLVFVVAVIINILLGVVPLIMVAHWLIFVEFTLHQSKDIIRRRYPVVMIPFWVGVVIVLFDTIAVIPASTPLVVRQVVFFLNRLLFLIWIFYVAGSYVVYYRETKRKSIPQYLRLAPTVISITLGFLISAFTSFQIDAVGYAVGLLFADYYIFRRLSFVEGETGFFNENYLEQLRKEADKKNIHNVTVIRFKTTGEHNKLAEILKSWEPEHSKIIAKNDGEFLVMSETLRKSVVERFISLIREHGKKEGLEIEASHEVIRKEPF